MIYDKNSAATLSKELFRNPTSEYRATPFWSWNCKLDIDEVVQQTLILKEMGFGGYHAHVRSGLDTEYLGEEFNACIKASAESAKKNDMYLYLYDEDRWPSGAAGGIVTKNKRFGARFLWFTTKKITNAPTLDTDGKLLSGEKLLARYTVCAYGTKLISYKKLSDSDKPLGKIWYAYLKTEEPRSFLNNAPYVDTMNKEAIDKFAEITYGTYKEVVGDYFGKQIKSIFTDEPQYNHFGDRIIPFTRRLIERAWTDDFDETFQKAYGYSLLDKLPELFWEPRECHSQARYHYFDHATERFANAYSDNLGAKCEEMGIAYTGHMNEEPTLGSQSRCSGDSMRHYRGFQIPGIDMLRNNYEFTTAKQTQSAVRQYGREAMLSELYGISRWDNDFRKYKLGGDWQAAMGVTIRVPHLSLMSMKGFAKRDYPASIFYQSPWYLKYKSLEDHYARVNTALTRGKPITEIAVIHPIEGYWMLYGHPKAKERNILDGKFLHITDLLLRGGLDFDFICEANLPELCKTGDYPLQVGAMQYKTVVIPNCLSLRQSTIERLKAFRSNGGKVVFVGDIPEYLDGARSTTPKEFANDCDCIPYEDKAILSSLEQNRLYGTYADGLHTENIVCQLREDTDGMWLFAARAERTTTPDPFNIYVQHLTIKVKGEWKVALWDTQNGEIYGLNAKSENGFTFVLADMYNHDSLLLKLGNDEEKPITRQNEYKGGTPLNNEVEYTLSEPNVLLLDTAYYALDGNSYSSKKCELLYLDNICRDKCGLPRRGGGACQPWAMEKREANHTIMLKFEFFSEIEVECSLALEDAKDAIITLNGTRVESKVNGWYVDKAIEKVALPSVKIGKNVLEIALPFGMNTNVEWCYLLGDFGVTLKDASATLTTLPKTLRFEDVTLQGLPFYGGKLTYKTSIQGNGKPALLSVPKYLATVLEAETTESKDIAFAPYSAILPTKKGKTPLSITAYISRQNAFGPIHALNAKTALTNPNSYYVHRALTTKRYVLSPAGIVEAPIVKLG